jgi:hypothetical protein
MEMEQVQALPDNARDKYLAWRKLLEHPSYDLMIHWVTMQAEECTQRLIHANNWDTHCAQFGAKAAYESIVNLKNSIEAEFSAIADEVIEHRTAVHFGETDAEDE